MKINEQIFRVTLPYKDIFTTVYTLNAPSGAVLFDAGSFDSDWEDYILPLLQEAGIEATHVKYVFISHNHKDHSGGLPRLLEALPQMQIVSRSQTLKEKYPSRFCLPEEGDLLLDTFQVITIPGHTADSAGLLDLRTRTLITGDCLQLAGIRGSGDWACNISYPAEHLAAIQKLRTLGAAQVLTAHDYVPYGYRADGAEGVQKVLDACEEALTRLASLIKADPILDDEQIREAYNDPEGDLTVNVRVVAAMRAALDGGTLK